LSQNIRVIPHRGIFAGAVLAVALVACAKPPPPGRTLPDFALTGVTTVGTAPLNLSGLAGRVWIADFIYTTCAGPCPLLSANMAGLQKKLPPAIGLLSFTVDPDNDTPQVLADYARRFGADPKRWLFVTGPQAAQVRLLREGFLLPAVASPGAPAGQNVSHSTKMVLIDAQGRIRGYYDGDDAASLDKIAVDARSL
jgi:protein SCO1/2